MKRSFVVCDESDALITLDTWHTDHTQNHMSVNPATSASVAVDPPAAPYRIPIQLMRPHTDTPVAPNFHLCLIDQLINAEQLAERRRIQAAETQMAPPLTSGSLCSVTSLAADRPAHDRLPVTIAISSADPANTTASSAPVGVQLVTLLQPAEAAVWLAKRDAREATLERDTRTTVRLENVPLAHASRCPCRAPLPPDESHSAASAAAVASACAATPAAAASSAVAVPAASATPSISTQLRLAVVVVPSLYSIRHCSRCAPALAPDASPCTRVLATRRPGMMRAFPGCWVFPGGACDPTDPSLEHTGAREVLEETGLKVRAQHMQLVSLWEAVFPVIRPSTLPVEAQFEPKARYLITMFTAEVQMQSDSDPAAEPVSVPSSAALAAQTPICVGCSVPLRLCPTEVDAAVWLSGVEFDALRAHASYFHTDNEAELQTTHNNNHSQMQPQVQSQRCLAGTEHCSCAELHAMVTPAYAQQHAKHTRLKSDGATSAAAAAAVDSASPLDSASAAASTAAAPSFLPAFVSCCSLFGLYPNRFGSGMAEGHLVALEEMRAQGWF